MAPPITVRPRFPLSQSLPSESFHKLLNPYSSEGRQNENHNHRKLIKLITWTTALSNSVELWAMPCRATQDGRVMVESSDRMWSTGEGNGKPLRYFFLRTARMVWKGKKIGHWRWTPQVSRCPITTRDQWRNNFRNNEEMGPKQKQHPVVDVTGDGSKVWCCKEQYCIGTWNSRSMNQGKLEMVKKEMARGNIDILGIWTGLAEFMEAEDIKNLKILSESSEAEDTKKRWQEYTEERFKKRSSWPGKPLWCDHSPRARHPRIQSQVGLR